MREAKIIESRDVIILHGYDGFTITREGEVYREQRPIVVNGELRTSVRKKLKPYPHQKSGTKRVNLVKEGRKAARGVAHLMVDAFYDVDGDYEVYYLDGDKMNCKTENLRVIKK